MMKTIDSSTTITVQLPAPTYRWMFRFLLFGLLLGYTICEFFSPAEPGKAAGEFKGPDNDSRINPGTSAFPPVTPFAGYQQSGGYIYMSAVWGNFFSDPNTFLPAYYPGASEYYQAYPYSRQEDVHDCSRCRNRKKLTHMVKQLGSLMNANGGSWDITRGLLKKAVRRKSRTAQYGPTLSRRQPEREVADINRTAIAPAGIVELSRVDTRVSPGSRTENSNCKTYY